MIVTTDDQDRPQYAYKKDQFKSEEELKKEIEKSIMFETIRKVNKTNTYDNIKNIMEI